MSKFKFYFIVVCAALTLFSCNKADDIVYVPLRFYSDQVVADTAIMQDYLKHHYAEITNNPGEINDQDIELKDLAADDTDHVSLWDNPLLDSLTVDVGGVAHTVYYLKQRIGDGTSPIRVDQVLTAYDGYYLKYDSAAPANTPPIATRFEYNQFPEAYFPLEGAIQGWREVIPLFKGGTLVSGGTGPAAYNNFGAGVMFLPSALGYYDRSTVTIPAYACLVFKFKLYNVKRADQDGDGILSIDEDLNHDGLFNNDDTDGDGVQNYVDVDDDGDGFLTRDEIKHVINGTNYYYPFNGAAVDDPATEVDETQGIPRKFTGQSVLRPNSSTLYWNMPATDNSDFTEPSRLRRHLDNTAIPPYYDNQ